MTASNVSRTRPRPRTNPRLRPRRRRDPSPRTIHVAAAAVPRPVPTDYPRRSIENDLGLVEFGRARRHHREVRRLSHRLSWVDDGPVVCEVGDVAAGFDCEHEEEVHREAIQVARAKEKKRRESFFEDH